MFKNKKKVYNNWIYKIYQLSYMNSRNHIIQSKIKKDLMLQEVLLT